MNSNKNEAQKLSDGWVLCTSKSNPGRKYYFNRKTGKSSWTEPQAGEKSDDKRKSKKEKSNIKEKKKKEDCSKNNLKRRSDGTEAHSSSFSKKRHKEENESSDHVNISNKFSPTKYPNTSKRQSTNKQDIPNKRDSINNTEEVVKRENVSNRQSLTKRQRKESLEYKEEINQNESTGKQENVCNTDTPRKKTPSKNIANARLSQFRAQLNADIQKEETKERSPIKNKQRSPIHTETSTKSVKNDKSPNSNESKSTQSPSSDSLSSIPSPSQFFAANKIISSMKAQLPEEYCNKSKQKDTFADIEQGICNQTTEYPFMKHPATPPQFSEASKLVSAIKSKLTYKAPCKETSVKKYASAKERIEALRARLSSEAMDMAIDEFDYTNEAMDVDFKEIKHNVPVSINKKDNVDSDADNVVLVVDTNIFIHELDFIKNVLNSHIKGYSEQPTLLVPWRVINELDRLKDNNNGNGAICKRAKSAMDYLYKSLPENNRIKGQSLRDANSHIYPCEVPDDEILNCCLQQHDKGKSVILLSNDKNLCNKARINGVKCIGLHELRGLLESQPRPGLDPALLPGLEHCEATIYRLLANVLENEMRAKYNSLWQHVLFKAPPWTLADVLQCLLKHWIAVFSDVFPRIEHLIADLRNSLVAIENKDPKSLSQSEVGNFKELCLEVARKCQIIPEYMELAKETVERLVRGGDKGGAPHQGEGEMLVIDAFEGVWTVFSSYCAKLCTSLGVEHNVEDKLCGPPHEALHGPPHEAPLDLLVKLPSFTNNVNSLTIAIKGVLSGGAGAGAGEQPLEEEMSRLEAAFRGSLSSAGLEAAVTRDNLRIFCLKCRNMLQEAYTKFTQLSELLEICRNTNVDT